MEESLDVRIVQSVAPATPSTTYNNKVPKKGEIIFNDELNNFKVGNGSTSYGNLNDFLANTTYQLTLNGTTNGDSDNGEDLGTLYAPTSFGATNKLLLAQGENAAPVWSSFNLSTGVLRFDDGWGLTSLQSLDSTDANRPILTRCTNLANNTGDRDHSYFSGKAFLNHSTGALTLDNLEDGVKTVLKPDSNIPFELSQLVNNSYVSIPNKIVTSNGLINAPASSGQVLLSNNSNTPIWQNLTLANLSDWPTPTGSGKVLVVTGQNNFNWTYLKNYSFSINTNPSVTSLSTNQITITTSYGDQSETATLTPKLFYKTSTTASGLGNPVDIRLYAGDNITFTEINESVTAPDVARSGIKISANVPSADIPIATASTSGKLVVSADANPTIIYKNTGSVVGVPIFYSSNGNPVTYIDTNPYTEQAQDVHSIQGTAQPFSGHYINIYDIITIFAHDQIALRLFKSVLGIR